MPLSIQKPATKTKLIKACADAFKETLPDSVNKDNEIFAQKFAQKLAPAIADAIEEMIRAQALQIIHTPTTLANSGGPVTGVLTIPPVNFTIN